MTSGKLAQALFSPGSVALVGATEDHARNNSKAQRFLNQHGYQGRIFPINPHRTRIMGIPAYPNLRSVPEPIDHVFIMTPAHSVAVTVQECGELGIPVATILSAGFAELGEAGARLQQAVVASARAGGVRLIGPNCIGVIGVHSASVLSASGVLAQESLRPGPLSVISQSGNLLGTVLSRAQARGLGFSKLVSVGNECDLGVGEIANMLVDDEHTGAILLFLETFRDADQLALAARRAHAAGKPIIAYKLGRSEVGRQAAASHTGAMLGSDEAANAFFRAHGIIRVEMMETLFELPQLVAGHRPPTGKRVAVVTGTGGGAAMVADRLGVMGARIVPPSDQVIARLRAEKIEIGNSPITDLPMGRSDGGVYTGILSAFMASDHCDAVVAIIGSGAMTNTQVIAERIFAAKRGAKPLAVFLAPKSDHGLQMLQENGVAGFRTPESCADAVNAYLNWRTPEPPPNENLTHLAAALELAGRVDRFNENTALDLFASLGIARAESWVIINPEKTPELKGMFAVKLLSPHILHKTDAGLVMLNVGGDSLPDVASTMIADARQRFPDALIEGVLVQRMECGLAEVIIGYRHEPEVGPTVVLGMGGILAELKRSISVRLAPVSIETAMEMIMEIPELAILRGYRNLPKGDIHSLARAIRAVSRIGAFPGHAIGEAEINPLIVRREGAGVVAVDGLIQKRSGD